MATKEEHRKAIESVRRERMGEVMISIVEDAEGCWAEALAERDVAREELRTFQDDHAHAVMARASKSAQPAAESAPVVGGVTEAMLDQLASIIKPKLGLEFCGAALDWFGRARDAIRKQKRVDVEAIREVARQMGGTRGAALLRAIGDEPAAEAAAPLSRAESDILAERASQRSRWEVDHDDEHADWQLANAAMAYISSNHKLWPFADGWKPRSRREDLVRAAALLIAEVERLDRFDESFQAPEVRAMRSAEAPAPIRTSASPCSMEIIPASAEAPSPEPAAQEQDSIFTTPEAEKLRARVAELDRANLRLHGLVGVSEDAASAAEKRVAELERDRDGWKLDAQLRARNEGVQKARADAAEAKLAALGENPIRRELVERHRHVSLFRRTVETLDSILAGRGPEVAS